MYSPDAKTVPYETGRYFLLIEQKTREGDLQGLPVGAAYGEMKRPAGTAVFFNGGYIV